MELYREGKVKRVWIVDEDTLEFEFTDRISVFDKIIPTDIPFKGETLCRTAAHWFKLCEEAGIKTDFKQLVAGNRMRVERVEVIPDYSKLNNSTVNYLIPLEFICRHYNAGSLNDRIRNGEVAPEQLGFPKGHMPSYGEKLPKMFFETTTKLEETDRNLTTEEAIRISGLTPDEYYHVFEVIKVIDGIIAREAGSRGLIHVDGKKEFAYDRMRRLMVVDTFGTADEDRWWDAEMYRHGKMVELSKEMVRQYYRDIGYHERLMRARKAGADEPEIPPLPAEMVEKVSALYIDMYERLTGQRFR
ncbi:MAG: phosphoribosylaminoimidazolesuccinocarboxamide synthase [Methanomassiliicoccales archaeon]|nr:MAG: phosphoribosylaminoimidazolesuccinocarboxamide synthase [Methanomassiliicoccales archaeon]